MKTFFRVIFSLILSGIVFYTFGRAGSGGGGHSSGGHSGGGSGYGSRGNHGYGSIWSLVFYSIAFLLCTLIATIYNHEKKEANKKKTRKIIDSSNDKFWQYDLLCDLTERMFLTIQDAWMERSLDSVSTIVTGNFYYKHIEILNEMIFNNQKNIIEDITISSIEILGCQDYLDDDLDNFTALIKGKLVDYIIDTNTNEILKNNSKRSESFTDLFIFTRSEGQWLLNDIINNPYDEVLNNISIKKEISG